MKIFYTSLLLLFTIMTTKAQTPMQISGPDCNGVNHDLFAELDAGKAVVVFFFMDACGSCPPVAAKVQTMCNSILSNYPGMITGYALPYINSTTCTATANWVVNNSLPLYSPYDSGAVQVANYGGFGMPTVVLLGGKAPDRRVMFSTLSFVDSDTTIMHDSIMALLGPVATNDFNSEIPGITFYPNPTQEQLNIELELKSISSLKIDLLDMQGRTIQNVMDQYASGSIKKSLATHSVPSGMYLIRTS
ncbi:MAG TPA: T9SS type A sorting domain-containing protein, partial [Chitinophagaceae bacterium]|nr:T9SS type A sorting domain-containing protein [Chitinophagaceae bacterium]